MLGNDISNSSSRTSSKHFLHWLDFNSAEPDYHYFHEIPYCRVSDDNAWHKQLSLVDWATTVSSEIVRWRLKQAELHGYFGCCHLSYWYSYNTIQRQRLTCKKSATYTNLSKHMHLKHAMKKRVTNNNMHKFISVRKWAALLVQYTRAYSLWNAEEFVVACQYPGAHDPASLIKRKQTFNITWWPISSSKTLRVQKKCSAHWTETELHRELQGQPHTRVGRDSNQVNKPLFHGWIAITALF